MVCSAISCLSTDTIDCIYLLVGITVNVAENPGKASNVKPFKTTRKAKYILKQQFGNAIKKYHSDEKCATSSLRTETIEDTFVMAINQVLDQKDAIIHIDEQVMAERYNTDAIQGEQDKAQVELEIITGLMEHLITMNASVAMDQDEYNRNSQITYIKWNRHSTHEKNGGSIAFCYDSTDYSAA